jgi:hypothetical protein
MTAMRVYRQVVHKVTGHFGVVFAVDWLAKLASKTKESFRLAGRGRHLSKEGIRQIVHLLSSTDMLACDIAERMSVSRTTISSINRRFGVRQYNGLRSSWSKADNDKAEVGRSSPATLAKKKCA